MDNARASVTVNGEATFRLVPTKKEVSIMIQLPTKTNQMLSEERESIHDRTVKQNESGDIMVRVYILVPCGPHVFLIGIIFLLLPHKTISRQIKPGHYWVVQLEKIV